MESICLVLTLNNRLIMNSVTYLIVYKPINWLIMEMIDYVSSINKFEPIGKAWF